MNKENIYDVGEPCGTSALQLELEKIIEDLDTQITGQGFADYDAGFDNGIKYAKKKCERLLEVVTGVYPESQLENIQE